MIANPHTRVFGERNARGRETRWRIEAPVKRVGLATSYITPETDRAFLRAALPVINGRSNGEHLTQQQRQSLAAAGLLVMKRQVSAEQKLVCTLVPGDGQIPRDGVLASSVYLEDSGRVPDAFASRALFVDGLDLSGPVAWVENAATRMVFPFSVPKRWVRCLERLLSREVSAAELPREARAAFLAADILVAPARVRALDALAARLVGPLRSQLGEQGFTAPFDLGVPPLLLRSMQAHYCALADEGWFHPTCRQSPRRMIIHNEAASRFFHQQMGHLISALMGTRWIPSYCFLARYRPGASLERHLDREQCGMSISWQIEQTRERRMAWPLKTEVPGKGRGTRAVASRLVDGEALAFKGTELMHFRDPLRGRRTATYLFLHFVKDGFAGTLE